MADGFRILENGDLRITEATIFRITEKYTEAFSELTATGSISAAGTKNVVHKGSIFFESSGSKLFAGVLKKRASSLLNSTGSSLYAGSKLYTGLSSLISTSSISILGNQTYLGSSVLSSEGSKVFVGYKRKYGLSTLNASGTLSSEGVSKYIVNTLLESDSLVTLVDTYIPFTPELYLKYNTVWKITLPYVKYSTTWKVPERVYIKVGSIWKRVY